MYPNSEHVYLIAKERHRLLLREAERSRWQYAAAGDASRQAAFVRGAIGAAKNLIHPLQVRRSVAPRPLR